MSHNDQPDLATIAGWIRDARYVMALTGAGISTESGIPDFRGPDGVWTRDPTAERLSHIEAYLADQHTATPAGVAVPPSLTGREIEILRLIAGGLTNAEIAEQLFISPLTCKSHVSRILTKLDARDRTQLVVMAYESGLVVPGHSSGPSGAPPQA